MSVENRRAQDAILLAFFSAAALVVLTAWINSEDIVPRYQPPAAKVGNSPEDRPLNEAACVRILKSGLCSPVWRSAALNRLSCLREQSLTHTWLKLAEESSRDQSAEPWLSFNLVAAVSDLDSPPPKLRQQLIEICRSSLHDSCRQTALAALMVLVDDVHEIATLVPAVSFRDRTAAFRLVPTEAMKARQRRAFATFVLHEVRRRPTHRALLLVLARLAPKATHPACRGEVVSYFVAELADSHRDESSMLLASGALRYASGLGPRKFKRLQQRLQELGYSSTNNRPQLEKNE